ncbi:MAG TPA: type II toxin-antitoxin system VapC family toxin [Gaiellaceae bacterium]|nr:type II toxin-antitoxin system VapC family toxin [Gaiellaceae bacterium]
MIEPAVVFDASAVLALLNMERGAEAVEQLASDAAMSSVNWCEAFGKLRGAGVPGEALRAEIAETGIAVIPFDRRDAEAAGELVAPTRAQGLSLADRACLALASRLGVPAVTADRAWTALDVDVEVVCIR